MGTWLDKNKDKVFVKFSDKELCDDIDSYIHNNGKLYKVTNHFFEEEIYKCCGYYARPLNAKFKDDTTPMKALQDDNFINHILAYMYKHSTFYRGLKELKTINDDMDVIDIQNIKSFFRNNRPRKVAQFPAKNVSNVVKKFFPNHDFFSEPLNYHDSSCGFGSRLIGSLFCNCNYYGTDPNKNLNVKLNELYTFLKKYYPYIPEIDIRCIGSEKYVPEWENKMDISFTSPPYFNLEIYSDDNFSSTKNYDDYDKWIEEYSKPTIENTIKYLKPNGYICINIKNISGGNPLYDDYTEIVKSYKELKMLDPIDLHMDAVRKYVLNHSERVDIFDEKIIVAQKL